MDQEGEDILAHWLDLKGEAQGLERRLAALKAEQAPLQATLETAVHCQSPEDYLRLVLVLTELPLNSTARVTKGASAAALTRLCQMLSQRIQERLPRLETNQVDLPPIVYEPRRSCGGHLVVALSHVRPAERSDWRNALLPGDQAPLALLRAAARRTGLQDSEPVVENHYDYAQYAQTRYYRSLSLRFAFPQPRNGHRLRELLLIATRLGLAYREALPELTSPPGVPVS